jgi:gliding motility-associated-like protein
LKARNFGTSIEWNPPVFLSNPTSYTTDFSGNTEKLYTIEIKTAGGCLTVDTQLVKVFKEVKFYVPSAFTPNNDGLNDFLKPISVGIKQVNYFRIYNRWGQLVYDLKNNDRGWDGNIGSRQQSTQLVVWMVEGIGIDNRRYRQKGTCILIR